MISKCYTAKERVPPSVRLKALYKVASAAKNAVILIYANPDPDGLASAWALKEILCHQGITASIFYTGEVGRLQNASMIHTLRLPASPLKTELLRKADLVAIVDAQPDFFRDSIRLRRCDIVIDHHPRKGEIKAPFVDVRPKCLATSSILTEYLTATGKPLETRLATALHFGITTDSQGQRRQPSPTDQEALAILERKADKTLLKRIEFSQYSLNDLVYFSMALVKHRYARNVLYAHLGPTLHSEVCSQVADFLIRVKEAHWALVSGVAGDKLVVVFRCDGHKKNAGRVAGNAFGSIGSAGGHKTMGRAEIQALSLPEGVTLTQSERLEEFVVQSLAKVDRSFKPLARLLKKEGK